MTTAFTLVHQQDDFIVVDKSADVDFHNHQQQLGLFHQVKQQLQLDELYPVHRLDKMTSGLVIMAKTKACAQQFQQLFEQHQVEKYYLALIDKKPKKKQGMIKGDMEKSRRGMFKLLPTQQKPAITQFHSFSVQPGIRLMVLKPLTGKTHQLRVAMNALGSPIMGDPLYQHKTPQTSVDRGYLHAFVLCFTLNGQRYCFHANPRQGEWFLSHACQQLIQQLHEPWQLAWPRINQAS